jgi:hypothetical protein
MLKAEELKILSGYAVYDVGSELTHTEPHRVQKNGNVNKEYSENERKNEYVSGSCLSLFERSGTVYLIF